VAVESSVRLRVDGSGAVSALRGVNTAATGATKAVNVLSAALKAVPLLTLAETARRFFRGFTEAENAAAAVRTLGVDSERLQKKLLGVTAELKGQVGQTELLAASYDVASAGFNDAASAADILKAASLGAKGGLSDLNTVADATTSVLNAYGLSSDKAAKLVDGFIQTQNDGKIVVAQYAQQIGRVAPVAAAAGVGIEDLNAAISTVTAQGVPIESTFAGIRQIIAGVLKPTAEAAKVAETLGIEFNTAAIKAKGFGGFLADVVQKTGGSEVALTQLFGSVEAISALLPLTNDGLVSFNENLENQAKSAGAAKDAANELGGTVTSQLTAVFNNVGTLSRQLDTALGPALTGVLGKIQAVTSEFIKFFALLAEGPSTLSIFQANLSNFFGAQSQAVDNLRTAVDQLNTQTITTEDEAVRLEAQLNRVRTSLDGLRANTTADELANRGLLGSFIDIGFALDELGRKIARARAAGFTAADGGGENENIVNPLQAQVDALLAQLKAATSQKTDPIEQQKKSAAQLLRTLEQTGELTATLTDKEREKLELQHAQENLATQFPLLSKDELDVLREQLEVNYNLRKGKEALLELDKKAREEADALKQKYEELDTSFRNGVVDALFAAVEGTKSLADSLVGVIKQMAKLILQQQLLNALKGFSFTSFLGFANGGRPPVGRPSVVGERGPELFVPDRAGTIIPNHALGGGGMGTSVVVNVDASGTSVEGNEGQSRQLGALIGAAVQTEIIKQQRPGGLLSR
jgi:TP901 family phage tail tape measure protein